MHLLGDRAVGDRTRAEPLHDGRDRLDLLDRHRRAQALAEGEQPAQRLERHRLVVDEPGVVLEDLVLPGARRVLELEHRLRVEQVRLALAAPLVVAADGQLAVAGVQLARRERGGVPLRDLLGQHVEADAAQPRGGAGEAGRDDLRAQAERLEDLRAVVGGHGGHAHLRHGLAHALAQRLDQVAGRGVRVGALDQAPVRQVLDRGHRQVRVDRGRAVADQQRHVVHLAGVAGLHHQADLAAGLLPDQVLVHRADEQQRRDRRLVLLHAAVGQHDDLGAVPDRPGHLRADLVELLAQGVAAAAHVEPAVDGDRLELRQVAVVVGVRQLGQLVVVDHRVGQRDAAAGVRARGQQVRLGADQRAQRGHQLLADGVQRRVGHLGEELAEVVEQRSLPARQRRQRGVVAHRADRLRAGAGHRLQQQRQLLLGVAEGLLAGHQRRVRGHLALAGGQRLQRQQALADPLAVGVLRGQRALDLLVVDDPPLGGVDEEHPARLQPSLADDRGRVDVQHADLRRQHDQPVLGHPVAGRAQAVAVEHGADLGAVGERHQRGAVPGLHQGGVELVERPAGRVHLGVVLPGLRDHHQHRVRQAAPAQVQQLQHLVEGGGVAGAAGDDREDPLEVAGHQVAGEHRLAGVHPVPVAAQGVDLAVVRHVPVRVRQRPGREGVGGEPGVHQADGAGDPLVGQVREERLDLGLGQHSLVDDRARGETGEVHTVVDPGVLGALAHAEGQALQRHPGAAVRGGQEQLGEGGHDRPRGGPGVLGHDRQFAPAQDDGALFPRHRLDPGDGLGARAGVGGQERGAHGVGAGLGQREVHDVAVERVRDLDQDSGPVTGVGFGASGTAVLQVAQGDESFRHDRVVPAACEVGHEGDAAGVVLEVLVVETTAEVVLAGRHS
ncbi:hypothetical protein UO65_5657 [Actinokineospora spheciospongiae]|uniref:Uncharacterized protein n=1 Tax=Actinokineospora spheciospongiae TaxID=909613 RepID=W7IET4_9PSEU|nr:hypothetical protein UO65_5657 [Actinokineospora spheciospongiae]